jgi:hypothetical protein
MRRLILFAICTCLLWMVGIVSACGGFFCTNAPIDQSAERIIFTINDDDTLSAIVGINYEGSAEDFSWVVPVPSPPELDVAPTTALNVLQNTTNPRFNAPNNYCRGVVWYYGGLGGGGGGYLEQGNVGPYDYAIIGSDNPAELIEWLRENGYRVTDDMQPIIAEYVFEGMYFLAMKLSNDAEVGDIQPVKMTYISDNPMVPLRLTAVAALDDMPVLIWIFGETAYSPDNYVHADVDFASFRARSQLTTPLEFNGAVGNYFAEQDRIQAEYDGRAFITEYAMPSINLMELSESVVDETYLADLINRYPYMTRLRAQLSPEQMTVDPIFLPDTEQVNVPQTTELIDYVDPLHYWGCSNREMDIEQYEELLPNTSALPNNTMFRYPDGWVQSDLTFNDIEFEAFAPQVVQAADVESFFAGESNFPILLLYVSPKPNDGNRYARKYNLEEGYKLPEGLRDFSFGMNELFTNTEDNEHSFALLTTDADWDENRDQYLAVSDYLNTYAYYAHPELRHTLALAERVDSYGGSLLLGFPEGWTEHVVPAKSEMQIGVSSIITPDDETSLKIEIDPSPIWDIFASAETKDDLFSIPSNTELLDELGLTDDNLDTILASMSQSCQQLFPVLDYDHEGRIGYLIVVNDWLVIVSGTAQEFEANQETMRWIAESVSDGYQVCG